MILGWGIRGAWARVGGKGRNSQGSSWSQLVGSSVGLGLGGTHFISWEQPVRLFSEGLGLKPGPVLWLVPESQY